MSRWTSSCVLAASTVLPAVIAAQTAQHDRAQTESHVAALRDAAAQAGLAYRASKLIGARLDDASGEEIGEVEDIVISADGNVSAVVVSVGGVLDIGDRLVAVAYDELRVGSSGELYVQLTRNELAARPAYEARSVAEAVSAQPPPREPVDAATAAAAQEEAEESFAGNDPRVAEGIAENKEAYDEDEARESK